MEIQKRIIYTITSCLPGIYIEWHQLLSVMKDINGDLRQIIRTMQDQIEYLMESIDTQIARNMCDMWDGFLLGKRYLIHDRVAKVSRRATHVPISAKPGMESRFWAFGGVQQKRENY